MSLIVQDYGRQKITPLPDGLYHAVCYAIYDLGTHYQEAWNNKVHKVAILFEIPGERIQLERDGELQDLPRAISKIYTLSLHEKSALRKDLQSWRNKTFTADELAGFDLTKLLGANCMLQVLSSTKEGKTFSKIVAITSVPKGLPKLNAENTLRQFSLSDENFGLQEIDAPQWILDIMAKSDEWQSFIEARTELIDQQDDIPF
jgi:hypothetical protein